jgi:predicted metal-binding membrane protein
VSQVRAAPSTGALVLGAGLAAVAMSAWMQTVRDASSMSMPGAGLSPWEGTRFTVQWGVMMAAMMLPSAAPMVMLYRTVSRRLAAQNDRVIPPALFAAVYVLLWLALGVPVYLAHVAVGLASSRWPAFDATVPYAVAATLALAGTYQLTAAKQACLRHCESPLGFLMRRWRSGYGATLRLAAQHAGYCIGCCWGLMVILVAVGAMSLPWVVAVTVVVFAEKILPRGWWTARVVGGVLIVLALAVALRPQLAETMRGQGSGDAMSKTMNHAGTPMP